MFLSLRVRVWLACLSLTSKAVVEQQCDSETVFPRAIGFPDYDADLAYNAIEVSSHLQSVVCAGVISNASSSTMSWAGVKDTNGDEMTVDFYETTFIHLI